MSDRELLALIPVFDAIMSEGNLSRAAERLGVTQPAIPCSRATDAASGRPRVRWRLLIMRAPR